MKWYGFYNEKIGRWLKNENGVIIWGPLAVIETYSESYSKYDKDLWEIKEFKERNLTP